MTNIYERLPGLAANARNFVTQLDAPTLHDRLNKLATACDQAHDEITTLRAQVADLRKDAARRDWLDKAARDDGAIYTAQHDFYSMPSE